MELRRCSGADAAVLIGIYRDAVLNLGRQAYTAEQVEVWARYPEDPAAFRESLSQGFTRCAVIDGRPAAFGQLNPSDHIALLYCRAQYARRGCASAVLEALEARAAAEGAVRIGTEASAVSRPLFEIKGYRVVETEKPVRHGIEFLRFRMEKELT